VIMQGTLEEMKRSGQQSTEQAWSAIANLNWAARSMDLSQKEALEGIRSSERQSKRALDASIAASRLDQRAWVTLEEVVPQHLEATSREEANSHPGVQFVLPFRNTGKTPAIKVAFDMAMIFRTPDKPIPDFDQNPEDTYSKMTGIKESALIGPGDHTVFTFPGPADTQFRFGPNQMKLIDDRRTVLYLVGKLTYHDIFPNTPRRSTKFCARYEPATKQFGYCPINRAMD